MIKNLSLILAFIITFGFNPPEEVTAAPAVTAVPTAAVTTTTAPPTTTTAPPTTTTAPPTTTTAPPTTTTAPPTTTTAPPTTTTAPPTTTTAPPTTTTAPPTTTTTAPTTVADTSNYAEDMLLLMNELRGKMGAGNLVLDDNLCAAADLRAAETAQLFSHTRPNGNDCFSALAAIGSSRDNYGYLGENIAYGTADSYAYAPAPFNAWVNSPGHYSNMINTNFTAVGIGKYYNPSNGGTYWVQFFGSYK